MKKGELTCKGFIHLIELEAEDAAGDADDLWVTLEALGYDSELVQNQVFDTHCVNRICMSIFIIATLDGTLNYFVGLR